jgi:hypothetical protein
VLATVSASRTSALMAQHRPAAVALTDGYHLAFWIAFALVIAAIAVAATILRPVPVQAPAEEPVPETAEMALAGCAD